MLLALCSLFCPAHSATLRCRHASKMAISTTARIQCQTTRRSSRVPSLSRAATSVAARAAMATCCGHWAANTAWPTTRAIAAASTAAECATWRRRSRQRSGRRRRQSAPRPRRRRRKSATPPRQSCVRQKRRCVMVQPRPALRGHVLQVACSLCCSSPFIYSGWLRAPSLQLSAGDPGTGRGGDSARHHAHRRLGACGPEACCRRQRFMQRAAHGCCGTTAAKEAREAVGAQRR